MSKKKKDKGPGIDELILLDMMDEEDGPKNGGCLFFILGAGLVGIASVLLTTMAVV